VQAIRERWPAPPAWREAQDRAADLAQRAADLPEPVTVTAAVTVRTYRPAGAR
jgi:hypothetical protein